MKKALSILMVIALMLVLAGCNRTAFDTTLKFDRAIISLPNGDVVEGEVTSWLDFDNSDQIQVKINGVVYLTHITNVVLIDE